MHIARLGQRRPHPTGAVQLKRDKTRWGHVFVELKEHVVEGVLLRKR